MGQSRPRKKAGVKIATGSDAGFLMYHGESACEIEEFVKGGFTPLEAIGAATKTAAECLRMSDQVGTLDAGKYADVVIVDGDPLKIFAFCSSKKKSPQFTKADNSFSKTNS